VLRLQVDHRLVEVEDRRRDTFGQAVDPRFQKMLLSVLLIGGTIMLIATTALVIAFRGFEKQTQRSVILIAFLLAFVLAACMLFLRMSIEH
jgi:hypothetical protein